jgi:alpha-beta hydrolase superfamily lysophospholipase
MSQESTPGTGTGEIAMQIRGVYSWTPPETEPGEGIAIRTNRGDIPGILHQAQDSRLAVIWVYGARGGYGGPGGGTYTRLAEQFVTQGITSLRLDYRKPNHLPECVLDLLAGVAFFKGLEYHPVVVVGHSFGGAVVISAGAGSTHVKGVVCLSSQTYGADQAPLVSPRPLLLVHGKADTRLPFYCSQQIYDHAREPKQLVLYEGAEHRLDECKDELEQLLSDWIPATLAAPVAGDAGS